MLARLKSEGYKQRSNNEWKRDVNLLDNQSNWILYVISYIFLLYCITDISSASLIKWEWNSLETLLSTQSSLIFFRLSFFLLSFFESPSSDAQENIKIMKDAQIR